MPRMLKLYEWQERAVAEAVEALREHGGALFNWGMGSGKTVSAIETLKELAPDRAIIIAPLSTHDSWVRTAETQGATEIRKAHRKNKAGKTALFDMEIGEPGWYIVGPAFMTRSDVSTWDCDVLVIDEVHQVTEKTSRGLKNLRNVDATMRLALSGTPARNKVENLWGVSRILWPTLNQPNEVADEKFWRWAHHRLQEQTIYTNQKDQWGNPKTVKQYTGEKEPGRIMREMPFVSIHLARERCCDAHPNGVLASLAEPAVMHETIEMLPEQKRIIRDMETQMVTFLEDNPMIADIPLTAQQRIRQCILGVPTVTWSVDDEGEDKQEVTFAEDCKSPYLDRVREILSEDDEPFVIYTDSQKFAEVTVKRLQKWGITAAEYSGKRKTDLKEFGAKYRVLVGVISAVGTGTDGLQAVASSEIWLSRDLDATLNEQAEARLFRTGQTGAVRRWILHDDGGLSEGRYSEAVLKRLALNRSLRLGEDNV